MTQKEKILLQFSDKKNVNVDLATSKLIDKLESKYKSLGKYDVINYTQQIQKITTNLKEGVEKNGDLMDEALKVSNAYKSMGDDENASSAQRVYNSVKNDFDEIVFLYQKLKALS